MATINGKELSQIIKELHAPFTGEYDTRGTKLYIGNHYYKERMNQVFGEFHYNIEYSLITFQRMTNGQEFFHVKCKLTILDDDGKPVIVKESHGGTEVTYSEKSERINGIQNLPEFACMSAYRKACKELGIFHLAYEKDDEDNITNSKKQDKNKGNNSKCICTVTTKDAFVEDDKTYKCKIIPFFNGKEGKEARLVIYKNKISSDQNIMKFIEAAKTGARQSRIEVVVKSAYGSDSLEQYIFQKFVKG